MYGEIEDEFYQEDDQDNITQFKNSYLIKGSTEIKEINKTLQIKLANPKEFDTINGLIINHFGYMPKENQSILLNGFNWEIASMDNCCIKSLIVKTTKK